MQLVLCARCGAQKQLAAEVHQLQGASADFAGRCEHLGHQLRRQHDVVVQRRARSFSCRTGILPRRRGRNAYCEICCDSAVKLVKQERDTLQNTEARTSTSSLLQEPKSSNTHVAVAPAQTTCPCTSKDGKLWNIDVVVK